MTSGALSAGAGLGLVRTERVVLFGEDDPFALASGETLAPVEVAYETYGKLDREAANAVVVLHALTGDAHAAGHHGDPAQRGWWDMLIGPGRALDTDRFFVVCANLLGGCQGTTGPSSEDPATGRSYGLRFPQLEVADLVSVHRALLAHLGIERPLAAIGGSLGGMQALEWALAHPRELGGAVLLAATSALSAQNIALSHIARRAILTDPDFHGGDYALHGTRPERGLSIARMLGHVTYLSDDGMAEKFGRARQVPGRPFAGFEPDFAVESYLDHQARRFLERFDANSYLYLTRLMDRFDAFGDTARAEHALGTTKTRFLVLSFDSDWRFSTAHSQRIADSLAGGGADVRLREIHSTYGHDSFLLPVEEYLREVAGFLGELADAAGV